MTDKHPLANATVDPEPLPARRRLLDEMIADEERDPAPVTVKKARVDLARLLELDDVV